jgi:hypothetical protein
VERGESAKERLMREAEVGGPREKLDEMMKRGKETRLDLAKMKEKENHMAHTGLGGNVA